MSRESFPDTRAWLRSLPMSPLDKSDRTPPGAAARPYEVFLDWLEHAAAEAIPEPHVAVLSTVDGGRADARVLLLRDVTEDGWWFSGPLTSPKGQQLQANPSAALTFYWREQGRQVRISGNVHRGGPASAARDFHERSTMAQAVADASKQSEVLADEIEYRDAVGASVQLLTADPDYVSDQWCAWRLAAEVVEFWQADPGRRHLRWRYRRTEDSAWSREVLWP